MTGNRMLFAALNILSETPDSGVYYEQFALGAAQPAVRRTACAR